MTAEKHCAKCDRSLLVGDFGRNRRTADGLQGWCKECSNYASFQTALRNKQRAEVDHPLTKRCPRCDVVKPQAAFNRAYSKSNGLGTYCRNCSAGYQREMRARRKEQ